MSFDNTDCINIRLKIYMLALYIVFKGQELSIFLIQFKMSNNPPERILKLPRHRIGCADHLQLSMILTLLVPPIPRWYSVWVRGSAWYYLNLKFG